MDFFFDRRTKGQRTAEPDPVVLNAGNVVENSILESMAQHRALDIQMYRTQMEAQERMTPGFKTILSKVRAAMGLPPL